MSGLMAWLDELDAKNWVAALPVPPPPIPPAYSPSYVTLEGYVRNWRFWPPTNPLDGTRIWDNS